MNKIEFIKIVLMSIIAICALFTGKKVLEVSHKILMYINQSRTIKYFVYCCIATFFIMGTYFSVLVTLLAFINTKDTYITFFAFSLTFSTIAFFSYQSYKLTSGVKQKQLQA